MLTGPSLIQTTSASCWKRPTDVNFHFNDPLVRRACHLSSAKRMNMNSRGCQPTEHHRKTNPTLKGSHNKPSAHPFRPTHHQPPASLFGPLRAVNILTTIPWVSPTAIQVVRLRRSAAFRRLPQLFNQIVFRNAPFNSPSAMRMNMNSRGCQPTEYHRKSNPTLKGSHNKPSAHPYRPTHHQSPVLFFGPYRADDCCKRVPWVSPTAIQVVRLRRTDELDLCGNYSSTSPHHNRHFTTS